VGWEVDVEGEVVDGGGARGSEVGSRRRDISIVNG
jgi:hypothetical protein